MHPDLEVHKCAFAYGYFKKHDDYDRIMDFDRTFFGYFDDQVQKLPLYLLRDIAKYTCYLGLFLHLL
jgi:hypothetical protein